MSFFFNFWRVLHLNEEKLIFITIDFSILEAKGFFYLCEEHKKHTSWEEPLNFEKPEK